MNICCFKKNDLNWKVNVPAPSKGKPIGEETLEESGQETL